MDHERVEAGPFAAYLHNTDPSVVANFALATTPLLTVSLATIDEMRAVFTARGRVPHVTFLSALTPALQIALPAAGFQAVDQQALLLSTPDTLAVPPLPSNVAIITLSADSALGDVREGLDVNERGFDPHAAPATDEAAAQFRQTLHNCRAFTLRYYGQGVSAGMFLPVYAGVTEVAGIATLEPFRRRGFGGIITAHITQAAFDHGADVVFLTVASDHAQRVYRRVGFQPRGTLQTYHAPQGA